MQLSDSKDSNPVLTLADTGIAIGSLLNHFTIHVSSPPLLWRPCMAYYCVNKNSQANGDHEVHRVGCSFYPAEQNRVPLGNHQTCYPAVREAKKHYSQVNGCYYCSRPCHTQ